MGYLPDLAAATPEPGNGALHLLIDEARRDEADALLNRLEGAVNTLQDLGLDDAQHRIIDEVVPPLIVRLRETLAAEYQPNEIAPFRMQASASAGSLAGAAKSLAIASSAIADADDAAENVSAAAEGIWSIVQMLIP